MTSLFRINSLIKKSTLNYFVFFLLLSNGFKGFSQEVPNKNGIVYQTQVYFEERLITGATDYQLSVYQDTVTDDETRIKRQSGKLPAFWVDGMKWGKRYFWRMKAYDKNKQELYTSDFYKFDVFKIRHQGYDDIRFDVKTNKEDKHAKGVIAVDYTKSVYDRQGHVIWTMPDIEGIVNDKVQIRDMKITADNTITFITVFHACEIDFYGNVIWKAPFHFVLNSDTIMYHHDFKKTNRGTYMVLGNRKVNRKVLGNYPDEIVEKEFGIKRINNQMYKTAMMGILLEFDKDGKLIWYWDVNDYVTDEDLNFKKARNGFPNFLTHDNGFGENEEGTKVYMSFRDLSRIIKIDKKTKKVELSYGDKYPSGEAMYANGLFKNQHDANVTKHNSIYILNNNGSWGGGISSVIELKDNLKSKKDTPWVWKFDLDFDTLSKGKTLNGGKVNELPNSNLLVCAGELNRIFEVTKNKEIVWDAFIYGKGKQDSVWVRMPQYRANWASQLNQFHFIPDISAVKKEKNKTTCTLTLNNTGNVSDSYVVEVYSAVNALLIKINLPEIKPNECNSQMLKYTLPASLSGQSYMIIRSKKGRMMKRLLIS